MYVCCLYFNNINNNNKYAIFIDKTKINNVIKITFRVQKNKLQWIQQKNENT